MESLEKNIWIDYLNKRCSHLLRKYIFKESRKVEDLKFRNILIKIVETIKSIRPTKGRIFNLGISFDLKAHISLNLFEFSHTLNSQNSLSEYLPVLASFFWFLVFVMLTLAILQFINMTWQKHDFNWLLKKKLGFSRMDDTGSGRVEAMK